MPSSRPAYLNRLFRRLRKFLAGYVVVFPVAAVGFYLLEEFVLTAKTPVSNRAMLESERLVRSTSDGLVVGYARPDVRGEYATVLNPPATFHFAPGDAMLVIGTLENRSKLHRWIGVDPGR